MWCNVWLYLLAGESVEWVTQKGLCSVSLFLAMMGVFLGIFPTVFGFFGGESNGVPFPPNPALGWLGVVFILVAFGFAIFLVV